MKIAIPEYKEHISPLLDEAVTLILAEFEGDSLQKMGSYKIIPPLEDYLKTKEVEVLLCGAASRGLFNRISSLGIQIVPSLSGRVDEIIKAYISGGLSTSHFAMPGCRKKYRAFKTCPYYRELVSTCSLTTEACMKIAVTAQSDDLQGRVDPRFGRAGGFMIYDEKTSLWSYVDNTQNYSSSQGAGIQSAGNIIDAGVSVVLTGNLGPKAYTVLQEAGVKSYLVADCSVEEALKKYFDGSLQLLEGANVEGHW